MLTPLISTVSKPSGSGGATGGIMPPSPRSSSISSAWPQAPAVSSTAAAAAPTPTRVRQRPRTILPVVPIILVPLSRTRPDPSAPRTWAETLHNVRRMHAPTTERHSPCFRLVCAHGGPLKDHSTLVTRSARAAPRGTAGPGGGPDRGGRRRGTSEPGQSDPQPTQAALPRRVGGRTQGCARPEGGGPARARGRTHARFCTGAGTT